MTEIIYRQLTPADVEGVYTAALDAWRFTYGHIFDSDFIERFVQANYAPERLLALTPQVLAGQTFFGVAVVQGAIAGFCQIGLTDRGGELFRIYLRPASIRQGIGRVLLEQGEAFVIEHGATTLHCFVHKDNTLGMHFYLRNGFVRTSERDQGDEWSMEKSLRQEHVETVTRVP